eukprot:59725_1
MSDPPTSTHSFPGINPLPLNGPTKSNNSFLSFSPRSLSSNASLSQRLFIRPTLQDLNAWKDEPVIDQPSIQQNGPEIETELLPNNKTNETQFSKHFGLVSLVIFSICSVVGNGIYVLAGTAGKSFAGTSLTISLIVGGIIDAGVCFSFVEYSSRYDVIGSNYIYTYITSGEILGYLIGFSEFVCASLSPSISAIAIVAYFETFLNSVGIETGDTYFFGKRAHISGDFYLNINAGAIIVIIMLGIICLFNVKCGSTVINIGAVWNIVLILICTFGGIQYVTMDNWFHPCDKSVEEKFHDTCPNDADNSWMPYGINGLIAAAGLCVWSIDGSWYCVTVAEEAKNPKRDIPRAIIICLVIVCLLFLGLIVVVTGMVPFYALSEGSCVADAFEQNGSKWFQRISSLGASSNMIISALGYTVAGPRQAWRFAKDGFIFECFAYLSPKTQIPSIGTFVFMIIGCILAGFVNLTNILSFGIGMICIWYSAIQCGLLVLRYCPPELYTYINTVQPIDPRDIDTIPYPKIINEELYITKKWNEGRIFKVIWGYFLLCIIVSNLMVNEKYFLSNESMHIIWWVSISICTVLLLMCIVCITYFNYKFDWRGWIDILNTDQDISLMPLVPGYSFFIIFTNCYMIATYGLLLLLECLALFLIGLAFYFCYGYKQSVLWTRQSAYFNNSSFKFEDK